MGLACGAVLAVVDFVHMIRRQGIITLEDLFEEMLLLEIHDEHDTKFVDLNMEERINERSKVRRMPDSAGDMVRSLILSCNGCIFGCAQAHIHDIPPKWLTHYGFDEITDEEYEASFKGHSLGSLAQAAGANTFEARGDSSTEQAGTG